MRSGSTISLSNRSKMPMSDPSVGRKRQRLAGVLGAKRLVRLPPRRPTGVNGVEVNVNGLGSVGVDLHHGRGGEHQDVRARRVLRGAQLCLHVERRAAAKHRTRRHRI